MNIETWLEGAVADAERRGLPELEPLLTGLARSTRVLRDADWNEHAGGTLAGPPDSKVSDEARPGGGRR